MTSINEKTAKILKAKTVSKGLKRTISSYRRGRLQAKNVKSKLKQHAADIANIPSKVNKKNVDSVLSTVQNKENALRRYNRNLLRQKAPGKWNIPGKIQRRRSLNKTKSLLGKTTEMKKNIEAGKNTIKPGILNTPGKKRFALTLGGVGLYGAGVVSANEKNRLDQRYDHYYK